MNLPSDNALNANNTQHRNVRVKMEPGTSTSVSTADSGVLKNIKTEPGVPTATTQRLTSYRLPRDLTLGGNVKTERPKKVYMPNLNAQRNRKKDESTTLKVEPTKSRDSGSKNGRERGRGDRGRGRANLIKSVGVWSEGINAPAINRRSGGSREGSSSNSAKNYMDRPKMNLNKVVNKLEEEEKLKNLLGDDSADNDPDVDVDYIMLPMNKDDAKKLCKKEVKVEIDSYVNENNIDKKPPISENGDVNNVIKKEEIEIVGKKKDPRDEVSEIIENKSNSYVLLQFPTCLPGLKSNDDNEEPPKRPNESKLNTNEKKEITHCNLNDLKNGLIGKLEVLRSGKVRLRLGDNYLNVSPGIQPSCLQHILAAKLDTMSLTGELVNLGPVKNKLVCSVSFETLLEKK